MKYPRLSTYKYNTKVPSKKELGKVVTQPNQAMSLKDIVARTIKGFPVPMAREELVLHPDLNQVLQGTNMDIISDAQYCKMSKTQRQVYRNNLDGLRQQLNEKVQAAIEQKAAAEAALQHEQKAAAAKAAAEAEAAAKAANK